MGFHHGFPQKAWIAILLTSLSVTGCKKEEAPSPAKEVAATEAAGTEPVSIQDPPPPQKPGYWDRASDFTSNLELAPNVFGMVTGHAAFLQNTWVGPGRKDEKRPLLVTDRAAYLVFFPTKPGATGLEVQLRDAEGRELNLPLLPPENGAPSDFDNQDGRQPVVFSKRAWTAVLPWDFMHPGLSLTFKDGSGATGSLPATAFEFGAPMELVTQHIELGMLVEPSRVPVNKWTRPGENISPELAVNYFQMVPVARFIAAQYLPIHLPKVVLPNGNVYTQRSTFTDAGIYKGDMRENIAKGLISTGINNANVGVTSSHGGDQNQPRPYRQTTVHTSAGIYTGKDKQGNEIDQFVVHGLSGGGGQLTLQNTTGNEFSHEYGHDHGLGHYPGGPFSTHRQDGAWGFHIFKHRLIGNLNWNGARPEGNLAYAFGKDAMAGGEPMGPISVFTLHTPYSLMHIQQTLTEQSGILAPDSPTGYHRWDTAAQKRVPLEAKTPKPDKSGIPVVTLVGFYDPAPGHALTSFIYPALYGNWGNIFTPATLTAHDPGLAKTRCWLQVTDASGQTLRFPLRDQRIKKDLMNQFHVNLPGFVKYARAAVLYQEGNGSEIELASSEIAPPHGELPEPVVVGRENGFTTAALRFRTMDQWLTPNGYPDEEILHRALEDYYGRILDYTPTLRIDAGHTYRHLGTYYQATEDQPSQAPSVGDPQWRALGQANRFLSTKRLALGVQSVDYAQEVLQGKSGVYYYVPVDQEHVTASEAFSPKTAQWYAKGNHSKITVLAQSEDGTPTPIQLRGQINDRHALNRGAPVNEPSRVRFRFHPEDNPDLAKGTYEMEFPAYARGWHKAETIEAFLVQGTVQVP